MIEGVVIKNLKVVPDERGRLMEIMRRDDPFFEQFGQAYISTVMPGVVKAWHYHQKHTDNFAAVSGMIRVALFDDRRDSPTFGELVEIFAGVHNPVLIHIPPGVIHGFKGIGQTEAIVVNLPTEPFDPNEPDMVRIDPHENNIPYNWSRKDG